MREQFTVRGFEKLRSNDKFILITKMFASIGLLFRSAMLFDEKLFQVVETECEKRGVIKDFEKTNGKIKGRMMITVIEIPECIVIDKVDLNESPVAFGCSFDFYDCSLGIALYPKTMKIASGVWVTPQIPDAEPSAKEWVEFFIKVLCESINEDGSFGYPMYTFISDTGDFTCTPSED